MKFIIYTPSFTRHCAGICALHWLGWELKNLGHDVKLAWSINTDPEKPLQILSGKPDSDAIAIYPEIIPDNPLGLSRRVRWILSPIGNDWKELRKNDMIVSWAEWDENPVLCVPLIDRRFFNLNGVGNRSGILTYKAPRIPGDTELHDYFAEWDVLAKVLKKAEYLRCGDNNTNVNEIARLCGCPVLMTSPDRNVKFIGGNYGIAFSEDELPTAKENISQLQESYSDYVKSANLTVLTFIGLCKDRWNENV
jgi:hypothetical protein